MLKVTGALILKRCLCLRSFVAAVFRVTNSVIIVRSPAFWSDLMLFEDAEQASTIFGLRCAKKPMRIPASVLLIS
jgi:hypothetical protein